MDYSEIFERHHWETIERRVFEKVKPFMELGIKLKLISELISELTEKFAAEYFAEIYPDAVRAATSDNDPDLMFGSTPLEIKVAKFSSSFNWRGGGYSKRESDYILITWDFDNGGLKAAVYKAYLAESDWIKKEQQETNYYATLYNMNLLNQNVTCQPIIGGIVLNKNNNAKPVFESI